MSLDNVMVPDEWKEIIERFRTGLRSGKIKATGKRVTLASAREIYEQVENSGNLELKGLLNLEARNRIRELHNRSAGPMINRIVRVFEGLVDLSCYIPDEIAKDVVY